MRKLASLIVLGLMLALGASAQILVHSVDLSWTPPSDATPTTTYNILKYKGFCADTGTFVQVNLTPITGTTYVDLSVSPGPYCYVATANNGNVQSGYSNTALAQVPSFPPGGLTVIVH